MLGDCYLTQLTVKRDVVLSIQRELKEGVINSAERTMVTKDCLPPFLRGGNGANYPNCQYVGV